MWTDGLMDRKLANPLTDLNHNICIVVGDYDRRESINDIRVLLGAEHIIGARRSHNSQFNDPVMMGYK